MPNPFTELPESDRWSMLVGAVKKAIQEEGHRLDRLPGRGRSNVWRVEKDGKSQRASFRTTQDRWFAFPSLKGGAGWGTLDSVELVFVAAVDDRDDPKKIEVYRFPADEVRERFNANRAARQAGHQRVRDNFGMWVGLDLDPRGIPASTGSGLADKHKPIAVYPIATLLGAGVAPEVANPGDTGDHEPYLRETTTRILASLTARKEVEAEPAPQPTTIAEVLAETRKLIALIAGVAPDAIKLDLRIEY
jgi:hypothetical protein